MAHATALEAEIAAVVAASEASNADDEHDPEGATIAFERAQLIAVLEATRTRIAEYDAALARVAAGRYGICDTCGQEIPAARLEARPAATQCVACAAGHGTRRRAG